MRLAILILIEVTAIVKREQVAECPDKKKPIVERLETVFGVIEAKSSMELIKSVTNESVFSEMERNNQYNR